jgi:hypothetical protein
MLQTELEGQTVEERQTEVIQRKNRTQSKKPFVERAKGFPKRLDATRIWAGFN